MTFRALVLLALVVAPAAAQSDMSDFEKVRAAAIAENHQPIFWQGDDLVLVTAINPVRFDPSIPDAIHIGIFRDSFDFSGAVLVDHNMDSTVDFKIVANQKLAVTSSDQVAFDTAIEFLAESL